MNENKEKFKKPWTTSNQFGRVEVAITNNSIITHYTRASIGNQENLKNIFGGII